MKAIIREDAGPAGIVMVDLPTPEPGPGELRLRLTTAAISFADRLIADGQYQSQPELPFVLGSEGVGVVDAIGSGIEPSWLRRKVMAYGFRPGPIRQRSVIGTWAEYVIVTCRDIVAQPPTMVDSTAAVFRTRYETAYYALRTGNLRSGDRLLVLGSGGATGSAAVELGTAVGADVVASASSDAKRQLAITCGARLAIDSGADDWKSQCHDATDGKGFDVVFDPVGGPMTEAALRTLKFRGRLLVVGFASGAIPQLPASLFIMKSASVIGINQMMFRDLCPAESAAGIVELLHFHEQGRFTLPHIAARLSLAAAAEAIRNGRGRSVEHGHVIIDMSL